jgi:hypothetical protein
MESLEAVLYSDRTRHHATNKPIRCESKENGTISLLFTLMWHAFDNSVNHICYFVKCTFKLTGCLFTRPCQEHANFALSLVVNAFVSGTTACILAADDPPEGTVPVATIAEGGRLEVETLSTH